MIEARKEAARELLLLFTPLQRVPMCPRFWGTHRPCIAQIYQVELVPSRYAIAEAAIQRLVKSDAGLGLRTGSLKPGEQISLEEAKSSRRAEFHCADFFAKGLDSCGRSDVIFFAVHIPCSLFPKLCKLLAKAKEGCRLFTYHSLDSIWWTDEVCPFRQVEVNVPETDTFSTSWSPQGYRFYVYVCDRSVPEPEIKSGRNETFSEWQAIWDQASKSYYYHNQETEASQWEVPKQAGCWQANWSEENQSWFYFHIPTKYSQWEAPKCLAELGWGAR